MFASVLIAALLLATVLGPAIAIGGWRPDVVTLTVVAFAIAEGPGTGTRYGFAAGLARDLLSGSAVVLGTSALVLLVVGTLVGHLRPVPVGGAAAGPHLRRRRGGRRGVTSCRACSRACWAPPTSRWT